MKFGRRFGVSEAFHQVHLGDLTIDHHVFGSLEPLEQNLDQLEL